MKDYSPKKLAFIAALVVTAAFTTLLFSARALSLASFVWYVYPAGGLFLFFITMLLFNFLFDHFVYNKIRLIYKNILDIKTPRAKRKEATANREQMISKAGEDVAAWASDKKQEIEDLRKLEEYRREFLGNVSHELKTPIFNIQGYVLTLLDGGLEDPAVNRSYLLRTEQSINRMISIVDDLDTISKLESGQIKLNFSSFDMLILVQEVIDMLEMEAKQKKIRLGFGQTYDNTIPVYADRQNMHQVVTNLVVNAIKYGTEGGRVKVSFFDMDEHILTEVTDSGIGIPREELPRIFERFYRGEKSRTRNHGGGSGLGLAIVKHIIEAHHQTINVRSTLGVGTTFAFTLKKA
ncbi:MAG: HAMP domain-containing sensor histidine kinase [Bacteroidales bacterium]|nr:HAMP domain-containing sensor histidine kinase [Bacteroidales bacterium]